MARTLISRPSGPDQMVTASPPALPCPRSSCHCRQPDAWFLTLAVRRRRRAGRRGCGGPAMADFTGDSGDNSIVGTADSDFIDVSQGGDDTVEAGGGGDFISFGGAYTSGDVVDGGDGSDAVQLQGDYSHATTVDFTN